MIIDYTAAVNGKLRLVPEAEAIDALRKHYQAMIDEGLLREGAEGLDRLVDQCTCIEKEANEVVAWQWLPRPITPQKVIF